MTALEVQGLTKQYGQSTVVDDLSFSVQQGQVFGFLGPNGSGKTTTIGMIFGIIRPTLGRVSVFGESSREALAKRRLGGTLEHPNLYPYLTGRENLRIVSTIKGLDKKCVDPALKSVDLLESADLATKAYSLGMKQRLALAAAMLGDPELLILDEPTNGLDPEGMREIRELIVRLSRTGRTILVSSHLLDEVEKISTHIAIIMRGRLQRCGAIEKLTGANNTFRLCADNPIQLFAALGQCELATNVRMQSDAVYLELNGGKPASISRYLADRGIYLNELSNQRDTLEKAFLAATTPGATADSGERA